jgi:phosphatidylinositol 3-kinase
LQVQLRVDKLLGCIPAYRDPELAPEGFVRPSALYIAAVLCDEFGALGIASITHYAEADNEGCSWDSLLSFAPKYRDLNPTAQIAVTVWEVREGKENPSPLGGTTMRLFSKKGRLKTGNHTLKLWLGQEGDITYPSSTPGKIPVAERGQAGHVERTLKKQQRGELEPVPWLDALSITIAENLLNSESEKLRKNGRKLELVVEIPAFDLPVLYQDSVVPTSSLSILNSGGGGGAKTEAELRTMDALATPMPGTSGSKVALASTSKTAGAAGAGAATPSSSSPLATRKEPSTETLSISLASGTGRLILIDDPELGKENPSEIKAQKLARSRIGRHLDLSIRPDTLEKLKIDEVLAQPPGRPLSRESRELLWRFRGELTKEGRALTRFLKCVDWSDVAESRQTTELMQKWAKISMADALELLSPDYPVDSVRAHAVEALESTSDEELLYFLLQLVQALRYEHNVVESCLAEFLVERARKSPSIASALYWYLCAELEDPTFAEKAAQVQTMLLAKTSAAASIQVAAVTSLSSKLINFRSISEDIIQPEVNLVARMKHLDGELRTERSADRKTEKLRNLLAPNGPCSDLTSFECPCPLDPEVRLLGIVPSGCSVFRSKVSPIRFTFKVEVPGVASVGAAMSGVVGAVEAGAAATSSTLATEGEDIGSAVVDGDSILLDTPSRLASLNLGRPGGAEDEALEEEEKRKDKRRVSSSPSATSTSPKSPTSSSQRQVNPTATTTTATPPHKSRSPPTATSSLPSPTATTTTTTTLSLIYKSGDDLRQDQLVLQLISLMDRLFKREHLDLRITAYQVLPTSVTNGLIEFVPGSLPLSQVIREHGSIHRFLSRRHTSVTGPYALDPVVFSNYIRSNAGYAVMTHVLGIGDRHMDNLMLTGDGRLFHIDFGYILGRDPKFSTAPLVLSRAMVDGMGGSDSVHYREFVTLCGEAFNILRKSANLLLSLIHLMAGSAIPDIRSDPEKAMLKVQERLMLGVDDAMAAAAMEQMLAAAQAAVLPKIAEVQHRVAQGWR